MVLLIEGIPKVVNSKHSEYDIYIGRGSMWGNPYKIGVDGTREECIHLYKKLLTSMYEEGLLQDEDILQLSYKRLGCYCKPQQCHGDVIVDLWVDIWQRKL